MKAAKTCSSNGRPKRVSSGGNTQQTIPFHRTEPPSNLCALVWRRRRPCAARAAPPGECAQAAAVTFPGQCLASAAFQKSGAFKKLNHASLSPLIKRGNRQARDRRRQANMENDIREHVPQQGKNKMTCLILKKYEYIDLWAPPTIRNQS